MKYIISKIGTQVFAIELADVLHIFNFDKLEEYKSQVPYIIGKVNMENKLFFIFDIRKKICDNYSDKRNKILIINNEYTADIHYEKKTLHYPAGFVFDNIDKIIEVKEEMIKPFSFNKDIMCINTGENIYPIIKGSNYLKEYGIAAHIDELLEAQKKIDNKIKEDSQSIYSKYDQIFKKGKIEEIWKQRHKDGK